MKSKAPLALMEQILMVLVFALSAALCLQLFVFSGQVSRRCEAKDRAVQIVQNAAEVVKMNRGDYEKCAQVYAGEKSCDMWLIKYDENWNETDPENAKYTVASVAAECHEPLMSCAYVYAYTKEGETTDYLFQIRVAWQEDGYE